MTIPNFYFQIIQLAVLGFCIVSCILAITGVALMNIAINRLKTRTLHPTLERIDLILGKVIFFTLYIHVSHVVEAFGHVVSLCPIRVGDFTRFSRAVSFRRH